ncbi:protein-lysine N-methyltransferase EEF2KMT [Rhinophrynus dorsalis]
MDPALVDSFQRHFLCCRRLSSLPWHKLEQAVTLDPSSVLKVLQKTVLHPLCQKYPPSVQYRRLFLSELIKKHESTGAEPLDDLYNALAEVLNSGESMVCHKTYLLNSGDSVTLSENMAIISEGTTGLVTWEAALSLAEWSIENKDIFTNRTILELGSGSGLTGLVICKRCFPKKYVFTDCHLRVLQQLKENIHLNGYLLDTEHDNKEQCLRETGTVANPSVQLSVIELNWENVTEQQLVYLQADVVIASDVVYDPEIITSFSKVLKKLFSCMKEERHLEVFVASAIRNPETYSLFQTTLDEAGLRWQVMPDHKKILFPYDTNCSVEILKLSLKI